MLDLPFCRNGVAAAPPHAGTMGGRNQQNAQRLRRTASRRSSRSPRRLFIPHQRCLGVAHCEDVHTMIASTLTPAAPEELGLSTTRLARLGEVMRRESERGRVPGAVALVARRGRIGYFEAFGRRHGLCGDQRLICTIPHNNAMVFVERKDGYD